MPTSAPSAVRPSRATPVQRALASLLPVAAALAALVLAGTAFAQAPAAPKADPVAGKAKVDAVCAACHGANGVSVSDTIPNLAGQRAAYLEAQLRAFKAATRRNAVMNAMAAPLAPEDIANVAAYFASLEPTNVATKSVTFPALAQTKATLPADYKRTFTMYQTVNRTDINQVRYLWANPVAVQAAREGKPMPAGALFVLEQHAAKLDGERKPVTGADGFYVADRLVAFTTMQTGAGWGDAIPEALRNGDWNYGVFGPDMAARANAPQGECLACHKPLDKTSYLFSLEPLQKHLRAGR
jgi:cytochrome c553